MEHRDFIEGDKVVNVDLTRTINGHARLEVEVDTVDFLKKNNVHVKGEEDEVEELTVEQISERLGKTVKVVK